MVDEAAEVDATAPTVEEKPVDEIAAVDLARVTKIDDKELESVMKFHPWTDDRIARGKKVVDALSQALKVIIENVPPSPDRSTAIRKLRECRMDCNSAITFDGVY